jgi:hypothetical protein
VAVALLSLFFLLLVKIPPNQGPIDAEVEIPDVVDAPAPVIDSE